MGDGIDRDILMKAYSDWVESYDVDADINPTFIAEKDHVRRLLKPEPTDRLLDLGCGTGRYLVPFSKEVEYATGVDINGMMLAECRKKVRDHSLENVRLLEADLDADFVKGLATHNKILASQSIFHLADICSFLKKVFSLLEEGGTFVFSDFYPGLKSPLATFFYDRVARCGSLITIERDVCDVLDAINGAGFRLNEIVPCRVGPEHSRCLSKESFEANRGKPFLLIYSVNRPRS